MAKSIIYSSGSPLCGSPIIYKVTAATLSETAVVSLHSLIVEVSCSLSSVGKTYVYPTRCAVSSGETVDIDVSSALRAVADAYEYTPEPPAEYPYIAYSLKAYDEYILNGELFQNVGEVTSNNHKALLGAYSDLDRIAAGGSKLAQHFSRKPTSSPELLVLGESIVTPISLASPISEASITKGPTSAITFPSTIGTQEINGRLVYVYVASAIPRYQFRFVNSLGCLESISVTSLKSSEMQATVNQWSRRTPQSFSNISRTVHVKQGDKERWTLNSGPIDRDWQQWFLHEFLMSSDVWLLVDNHWLPCHIILEETTTIYDEITREPRSVSFTIEFDFYGSPYLSLTV